MVPPPSAVMQLSMQTPASRYHHSPRGYPEALPPIEYALGNADHVRKVQSGGKIVFGKRSFHIGMAFAGHPVALRSTQLDGAFDVFFCTQRVGFIDLKSDDCTN